jgi:hypothetical protein
MTDCFFREAVCGCEFTPESLVVPIIILLRRHPATAPKNGRAQFATASYRKRIRSGSPLHGRNGGLCLHIPVSSPDATGMSLNHYLRHSTVLVHRWRSPRLAAAQKRFGQYGSTWVWLRLQATERRSWDRLSQLARPASKWAGRTSDSPHHAGTSEWTSHSQWRGTRGVQRLPQPPGWLCQTDMVRDHSRCERRRLALHREGMVTTGGGSRGAVSAMLKRFISCRNTCFECRSPLSIQNHEPS